jgi:hypothetical protein
VNAPERGQVASIRTELFYFWCVARPATIEADRARGVCAVDYCWCPWCVVLRSVGVLVGSRFSLRKQHYCVCSVVGLGDELLSCGPECAPGPHSAGELSRRSGERVSKGVPSCGRNRSIYAADLICPIGCAGEIVRRVLPKIEKIYRSTDGAPDALGHGPLYTPPSTTIHHRAWTTTNPNSNTHRQPIMPVCPNISGSVVRPY